MADRILVLDNEAALASMMAKVLERDRCAEEQRVEIRFNKLDRLTDPHGMLKMSRKERRAFGSPRKHMKGLR